MFAIGGEDGDEMIVSVVGVLAWAGESMMTGGLGAAGGGGVGEAGVAAAVGPSGAGGSTDTGFCTGEGGGGWGLGQEKV